MKRQQEKPCFFLKKKYHFVGGEHVSNLICCIFIQPNFNEHFEEKKNTLSNTLVHQKQFSTRAAIAIDLLSSHYWTNYHFHSDKQQTHYSQRSNTIFYFRERKHTRFIKKTANSSYLFFAQINPFERHKNI